MSERSEMTCEELAEVAAELALGVLTGRERAAALAHLDECDGCREDVRQLMATSDQLLSLLPPAEPPAGFETRVLDRLGLSAPAPAPASAPDPAAAPVHERGHAELLQARRPGRPRRSGRDQSGPGRTGRLRRALAVAAVAVAVVGAGVGGWRIGAGSPAPHAVSAAPLAKASLLSDTRQHVGEIFLYSGSHRWLYMSVYLGGGDESVKCQVIGTNGRVTTIGSFRLTGGYGGWGTPDPGNAGTLSGARLVAADGTVLASAAFPHW